MSFSFRKVKLKCCFTSTETIGLLETGAQDVHLDFHTAPELLSKETPVIYNVSLKVLALVGKMMMMMNQGLMSLDGRNLIDSVLLYVHRNHEAY